MSHFISNAKREEMQANIFGNEVWPRLSLRARYKMWWHDLSRDDVFEVFQFSLDHWQEGISKEEWIASAEREVKMRSHGAVSIITLWIIGVVINLLWQWWLRRRDLSTMKIMRG